MENSNKGTLYVVATPIGNLEDITLRALRILGEVDFILCEDTRKTKILLSHYKIKTRLVSYHSYNESNKLKNVLESLREGKNAAMVSESGTPCISDPGSLLVREALKCCIRVSPVPGPSALSAALSMSGAGSEKIVFLGFLPKIKGKRQKEIARLKVMNLTALIYESPKRVISLLEEINSIMPQRDVLIIKEISKVFETYYRGKAAQLLEKLTPDNLRGEFILLLFKGDKEDMPDEDIKTLALNMMRDKGISQNECAKLISKDLKMSKSSVYDIILKAKNEKIDR